ncbi:hypothetical protein SB85_08570 [Xanthomonas sacchari]|nr:hypothetical protein SB85_08570 [Xanthomonas sacchari]
MFGWRKEIEGGRCKQPGDECGHVQRDGSCSIATGRFPDPFGDEARLVVRHPDHALGHLAVSQHLRRVASLQRDPDFVAVEIAADGIADRDLQRSRIRIAPSAVQGERVKPLGAFNGETEKPGPPFEKEHGKGAGSCDDACEVAVAACELDE